MGRDLTDLAFCIVKLGEALGASNILPICVAQ